MPLPDIQKCPSCGTSNPVVSVKAEQRVNFKCEGCGIGLMLDPKTPASDTEVYVFGPDGWQHVDSWKRQYPPDLKPEKATEQKSPPPPPPAEAEEPAHRGPGRPPKIPGGATVELPVGTTQPQSHTESHNVEVG